MINYNSQQPWALTRLISTKHQLSRRALA